MFLPAVPRCHGSTFLTATASATDADPTLTAAKNTTCATQLPNCAMIAGTGTRAGAMKTAVQNTPLATNTGACVWIRKTLELDTRFQKLS